MKNTFLTVLLLIFQTTAIAATHEKTLANGLKVIVQEDHRAPIVVFQIWYKVGSSYEPNGLTGISHMLEHMMFKGTKSLQPGEFSRVVAAHGGQENAFTSKDYTGYFQIFEKSRIELSFELEAERMRHLVLTEQEFNKEKQVVMEERRTRIEDNPQSQLYERFQATAYLSSNYHQPVIGWMHDIEQYKLEDLKQWYAQWYAPNNATVVIVGDVDPETMFDYAEQYFGQIEKSVLPVKKQQKEVESLGLRTVNVHLPAKQPVMYMGFNVPVIPTAEVAWEPYALEVLSGILGGGNSARLVKKLVREKPEATTIWASYTSASLYDELLQIGVIPSQGVDLNTLEQSIMQIIEQVKKEGISADELKRIKRQVIASHIYAKDSIFKQARKIGYMETVGLSWKDIDNYVNQIQSVTKEQVQAVAQKYLTQERLTIGKLIPKQLTVSMNHIQQ